MSDFQLDPGVALIVIDLQKAMAVIPLVHALDGVVARTVTLLHAFRDAGRPVVLVNTDALSLGRIDAEPPSFDFPQDWTELLPELGATLDDILVTKQAWSAFARTGLEDALRARGVTQVVVAGIATSMGVEGTARNACALGFNVAFATDAMTDVSADAHNNSIERIFPLLGQSAAAATIAEAANA